MRDFDVKLVNSYNTYVALYRYRQEAESNRKFNAKQYYNPFHAEFLTLTRKGLSSS